jgi:PRTRC genetic system protein C
MALKVEYLTRSFVFEKDGKLIPLPDPGAHYPPEKVMSFYSNTYPELTTGSVDGPVVVKDQAQYKMKAKTGTHG